MHGNIAGSASINSSAVGAWIFSRPQLLLRLCAFTILLCTLGSVALMLHVPIVSVDADMGENRMIEIGDGTRLVSVPGETIIAFRSVQNGETVRLPAALLPGVAEPRGQRRENARYWAGRDRVAAIAASGPVNIIVDGRTLRTSTRARVFSDLTTGFWLSLIAGAVAALTGLWVWVLRPRAWAPAMFALSGTSLFVGCATTALNISSGLGLNGSIDHAMLIANYISGLVCAGTVAALFARFPLPLIQPIWLWGLGLLSAAIAATVSFDLLPNAVDLAILLCVADSFAIIALLAMQAWYARKDCEARAALLPIAIGAAISVPLFGVLSLAGQLNGGKPLVSPDMTAPLLLMLYLGLGVAIIRARLFALGRWALSMLLSACAILLFVVLDAILLTTVTQQRDLAFFLSAVIGITVYLPMREWILRRAERMRDGQSRDLMRFGTEMALAPTQQAAMQAWRSASIAMFEPLDVASAPYRGDRPEIMESGSALYFPSPMTKCALMLRYPGGGTRSFATPDLEIVLQFIGLVGHLLDARDAYLRGVTEERGRIARDLHDDVSARLLTSLHRADPEAMHEDVRSAMADIRTIVTGLSGRPQSFASVLANLRHETQARLEASGVALEWPILSGAGETVELDYSSSRHVVSVVRECVSNIIRHAEASSALILINRVEDLLVIDIKDDGRGISLDIQIGNGLANARRRAESMRGTFELKRYELGSHARLTVPLAAERISLDL